MPKKTQKEKFIDKAKELECSEDEKVFEKTLQKIAILRKSKKLKENLINNLIL